MPGTSGRSSGSSTPASTTGAATRLPWGVRSAARVERGATPGRTRSAALKAAVQVSPVEEETCDREARLAVREREDEPVVHECRGLRIGQVQPAGVAGAAIAAQHQHPPARAAQVERAVEPVLVALEEPARWERRLLWRRRDVLAPG